MLFTIIVFFAQFDDPIKSQRRIQGFVKHLSGHQALKS